MTGPYAIMLHYRTLSNYNELICFPRIRHNLPTCARAAVTGTAHVEGLVSQYWQ